MKKRKMLKSKNIGIKVRKGPLTDYFFEAIDYIKKSKNYIYFIIGVFIASALAGFIGSDQLSFIDKLLKDIIARTQGLNSIELINFIFINNLQISLYGLFLGIIFGVFPLFYALLNGTVLGYVFSKVYQVTGINEFWRILPHGIFELPAVFISLGLGVKLGMFFFSNNQKEELKYRIYNSIKVLILVVTPLLIVAAIIEGLLIAFYK